MADILEVVWAIITNDMQNLAMDRALISQLSRDNPLREMMEWRTMILCPMARPFSGSFFDRLPRIDVPRRNQEALEGQSVKDQELLRASFESS